MQLSQPAEAGWHFYADDDDSQIAASLASAWAEAFVAKAQAEIEAGNINEFVKLEATQSKNLPKERSIHSADICSQALLVFSPSLFLLCCLFQPKE